MQPIGILPIDKPIDVRSTLCVDVVRQRLGRKTKVGHGGTLDSTASGLLILLVGNATRLSNFVMSMPKCYEAEVRFGFETTTDDASGDKRMTASWSHITEEAINTALCGFMGWRMQTPPNISAVHVDGERAHRIAREGKDPEISAKPVFFMSIEKIGNLDDSGCIKFRIHCRKGTYIRSFARDLGRALGSAAHISSLRRTSCGMFRTDSALKFEDVCSMGRDELAGKIWPLKSAAECCASYYADDYAFKRLSNGQGVMLSELKRESLPAHSSESENVTVLSDDFFSICRMSRTQGTYGLMPDVNIIIDRGNTK